MFLKLYIAYILRIFDQKFQNGYFPMKDFSNRNHFLGIWQKSIAKASNQSPKYSRKRMKMAESGVRALRPKRTLRTIIIHSTNFQIIGHTVLEPEKACRERTIFPVRDFLPFSNFVAKKLKKRSLWKTLASDYHSIRVRSNSVNHGFCCFFLKLLFHEKCSVLVFFWCNFVSETLTRRERLKSSPRSRLKNCKFLQI